MTNQQYCPADCHCHDLPGELYPEELGSLAEEEEGIEAAHRLPDYVIMPDGSKCWLLGENCDPENGVCRCAEAVACKVQG